MKQKIYFVFSILFLLCLLCACAQQSAPPAETTPSQSEQSPQPLPTAANQAADEVDTADTSADMSSQTSPALETSNAAFTEKFGDFETTDLDGNPYAQDMFAQGKLTMLNIWGTFCSPCLAEMPHLGELSEEYQAQGLQIIGIVVDVTDRNGKILQSQVDLAKNLAEQTGANYLHLLPSQSLNEVRLDSVYAIPETVFVNKDGYIVGDTIVGACTKEEWKEIIDERFALLG